MCKDIERTIAGLKKQVCELLVISKNLEQIDACKDEVLLGRLTNDFVAKCETLTCRARNFAMTNFFAPMDLFLSNAAQIQGIVVRKEEEILCIELPFLLPKKKHKNAKYICDPLYYALQAAAKKTELKIEEKTVVCFVHIYDKVENRIKPRDYDNVEAKRVLDIVALFALRDDGAEFCDIVNTMEYGRENKTFMYIMPERCYFKWQFDRTNHEKKRL